MSTLLASASPRPLVTSGMASVMPPVPVVVVTPVAVAAEPGLDRELRQAERGRRAEGDVAVRAAEVERRCAAAAGVVAQAGPA